MFTIQINTIFRLILLTTIFAAQVEAAAIGNNLVAGGKCEVTEGSNKGKTGTYGSDGWCEGDWGGTECAKSKCKDAVMGSSLIGKRTMGNIHKQSTVLKKSQVIRR